MARFLSRLIRFWARNNLSTQLEEFESLFSDLLSRIPTFTFQVRDLPGRHRVSSAMRWSQFITTKATGEDYGRQKAHRQSPEETRLQV